MKVLFTKVLFEENVGFVQTENEQDTIITPMSMSFSIVESFNRKQILIHNIRKAEPESIDTLIGYSMDDWENEKDNFNQEIIDIIDNALGGLEYYA